MIGRANRLNDGRDGICFMTHRSNDLGSLVGIVAAAATPCVLRDPVSGRSRCAAAGEVIPLLGDAAVAGRASDPVIVERLGRLAFERRLVALDDPVGVYVQGVEHARLRTPDGAPVPKEWFVAGRGSRARGAGRAPAPPAAGARGAGGRGIRRERPRRRATELPIRHGAQIAELVQLRVLVRMSAAGAAGAHAGTGGRARVRGADPCRDMRAIVAGR